MSDTPRRLTESRARAFMPRVAKLYLCLAAVICGCTRQPTHISDDAAMQDITFHLLDETPEFRNAIQLVRVPNQTGVDEVLFEFRNGTQRTLELPSCGLPPKEGILQPVLVQCEVMTAGKWRDVTSQRCGDMLPYSVKPNENLLLLVYLDNFRWRKTADAAIVRIRLGEFTSEPFVLGMARYARNDSGPAAVVP